MSNNVYKKVELVGSSTEGTDDAIRNAIAKASLTLRHLDWFEVLETRGQVGTMRASFTGMSYGLVFAVILVYFVMVVNFQSWVDPFIILTALPGAMAGLLWMLYLTRTTLSVPSLMGALMCIGVATANSILLVTFANDERAEGKNAIEYAAGAAMSRPTNVETMLVISEFFAYSR